MRLIVKARQDQSFSAQLTMKSVWMMMRCYAGHLERQQMYFQMILTISVLTVIKKCSNYMCLTFKIDEEHTLVLHIQSSTKEEILKIKESVPVISNYFEMAKPVIESKILMAILKDTVLRDPMTKLYNRRFFK